MYGYGYGGGGGYIQQGYEQERMGFGPQGYGVYEQGTEINRNLYNGAATVVRESEFIPMGGMGYGGYGSPYGYPFY
ncbi:unnamed protein product [Adineta steineri]|uniref:Uncharacterized protein n=1 Tax=Adineta steineri TaxID=433720 RepID=A0A813YAJ8_9BILA|nr:unnamed protein product [Adineta steineri]CAF4077357.1 unnamed protein product [Adineta steineri]